MKITIELGERLKCKKDLFLQSAGVDNGKACFIKGRFYVCEVENALTDELGNKRHYINDALFAVKYFKEI